jgi:hypothetical protein
MPTARLKNSIRESKKVKIINEKSNRFYGSGNGLSWSLGTGEALQ